MDTLKVAMAIQNIAMSCDDETLKNVRPKLDIIEKTFLEMNNKLQRIENYIDYTEDSVKSNPMAEKDTCVKEYIQSFGYEKIKKVIKDEGEAADV